MAKLEFNSNVAPTIGVEIELGIVDAESQLLVSGSNALIERVPTALHSEVKHELMQCCIEVISGVCHSVPEAREDLVKKLKAVEQAADAESLALWWGATHPFGLWENQDVTDNQRYKNLVLLLQELARRLITNGLHVHVGVDSGDKAVMICDRIMQYLPTLLALSASSPYWQDRDTGLQSHRSKLMEGLPTAGLPTLMRNWSEYVWLVNHMVETGFINTIREIWWDVRPHHNFGTVEVRVCDMPGSIDHVCGLAALMQCLVKYLSDQIDEGTYQFDCHPMMVRQNKWRAARYGNTARLVNARDYRVQSVAEISLAMVDELRGIAQDLGCEAELLFVKEIALGDDWAKQQREIFKAMGDDKAKMVKELGKKSRISDPVRAAG
ncbi:MAG: YbdK family carboxylate-amine ligase [Planctomycetota bacterium]